MFTSSGGQRPGGELTGRAVADFMARAAAAGLDPAGRTPSAGRRSFFTEILAAGGNLVGVLNLSGVRHYQSVERGYQGFVPRGARPAPAAVFPHLPGVAAGRLAWHPPAGS